MVCFANNNTWENIKNNLDYFIRKILSSKILFSNSKNRSNLPDNETCVKRRQWTH